MATSDQIKTEELTALLREVRERVRSQYTSAAEAGVALPDLMPILHARDAALAKVAAIGSVNPRPPGLLNGIIQSVKRAVSRALDWHVRDQVEFNRGIVAALEAVLEALNENNRALAELAGRAAQARQAAEAAKDAATIARRASDDAVAHWSQWRIGWEKNLDRAEKDFLRSVAELHASFSHEVAEKVRLQHSEYKLSLAKAIRELQESFWSDMGRARAEMERLIQSELRVVRQRLAAVQAAGPAPPPDAARAPESGVTPSRAEGPAYDTAAHAERFRGSEEYVREKQRRYVPLFKEASEVLDIGCGRGEFLALMREAGVKARGIDLSAESIALCRERGLDAELADAFAYLAALPDATLGGVFSAQVVEHIPPARLPELIRLIAAKLERGGRVAIETPNPECLAIFASHFYLDPTHERPVPPALLRFYMEEAGLSDIRVEMLSPAAESIPAALAGLPPAFRDAFFGGLDYAIIATR